MKALEDHLSVIVRLDDCLRDIDRYGLPAVAGAYVAQAIFSLGGIPAPSIYETDLDVVLAEH